MKAYHIKNKEIISIHRRLSGTLPPLICALLVLFSPTASAHKLNMFAYVDGTEIFVEGYFTDGKKAKNSTVTVFDADARELLNGVTDEDGQFSFAIPQQSDMRITVNAGMGHLTEYSLLKGELQDEPSTATSTSEPVAPDSSDSEQPDGPTSPVVAAAIDEKALRLEVERAVGKAIKPLMRELSEMRAEKSFADIVGGVGFIFGLLGIFMYFKARKGD